MNHFAMLRAIDKEAKLVRIDFEKDKGIGFEYKPPYYCSYEWYASLEEAIEKEFYRLGLSEWDLET